MEARIQSSLAEITVSRVRSPRLLDRRATRVYRHERPRLRATVLVAQPLLAAAFRALVSHHPNTFGQREGNPAGTRLRLTDARHVILHFAWP